MADNVPINPDDEQQAAAEQHVKEIMEPVSDPTDGAVRFPARTTAPELASADIDEAARKAAASLTAADDEDTAAVTHTHPSEGPRDDKATDEAVEDIMKTEGDEALQAQDAKTEAPVVVKLDRWERFKGGWRAWWKDPRKRYATIAGLVVIVAAIAVVPVSRTFALNLIGVRGSVAVKVLDGTTSLPLKNVTVTIAGQTGKTANDGSVVLRHVRLGNQTLTAQKVAFAGLAKKISVGMGKTTVPALSLKAVGTQFTFVITDYVSGKAIPAAEVTSGQASARADKTGKAVLTVPPTDKASFTVKVSAKNYRSAKQVVVATSRAPQAVALVPSGKEVFISKQSGKYDLYKADIDGKNRKLLLGGTGNETANLALSVSPDGGTAALVSTRDNQRDSDGYLLSTLTLINVDTGSTLTLEHAENVSLLGWSGDRLVYQLTVAGASAANPNRQRIISYDYVAHRRLQLASANYFNGVVLIGSSVYYAVSNTDPTVSPSFNKIGVDTTGKQTLTNQEVWTVVRTGYATIALQTPGGWLNYTVGSSATKPGIAPDSYQSRRYLTSGDGSHSLWIDSRDGKGVLVVYDIQAAKDRVITSRAGLGTPVRWLNDQTVIFRVTTDQETADYAVSLTGGQPHKITDVTATAGL